MNVVIFLMCLFLVNPVFSSDHVDGPLTTSDHHKDLSDLYAFPTPGKPGFLTLVLNAHPAASKKTHHPEQGTYSFILREATINPKSPLSLITTEEKGEIQIYCTFKTSHEVTCKTNDGRMEAKSFIGELKSTGDFRVYAGLRADPFFFNLDWFKSVSKKGKLIGPKKKNTMKGLNVISLVVEVELAKLFPATSKVGLVAVVANVVALDLDGAPNQLDWIGRPEITNVTMVSQKDPKDPIRDEYNKEVPYFNDNKEVYRTRITKNIKYYDALDGDGKGSKLDWTDKKLKPFVEILLNDHLVVDISKDCSKDNFLDIELAVLNNIPHTTCGGRKLDDDIMDTLYSTYIGSKVSDGIDKPNKPSSSKFPYLQEPDTDLAAELHTAFMRAVLDIVK